jgi:hypothetical protein
VHLWKAVDQGRGSSTQTKEINLLYILSSVVVYIAYSKLKTSKSQLKKLNNFLLIAMYRNGYENYDSGQISSHESGGLI